MTGLEEIRKEEESLFHKQAKQGTACQKERLVILRLEWSGV